MTYPSSLPIQELNLHVLLTNAALQTCQWENQFGKPQPAIVQVLYLPRICGEGSTTFIELGRIWNELSLSSQRRKRAGRTILNSFFMELPRSGLGDPYNSFSCAFKFVHLVLHAPEPTRYAFLLFSTRMSGCPTKAVQHEYVRLLGLW